MSYFSFMNPKNWFEDPVDSLTRLGTYGLFGGDDLPYIGDSRKAERNYQEQKKVQDYEKQLQERIFEREDSSLQRRVEDAVLAGLNPQLALSGGAGTGQAIPLNVPQKQQTPNMLDALSTAINFKTGLAALEGQNLANEASKMNLKWFKDNNLPTTANGDYVSMLQAIGSLLEGIKGNSNTGIVSQTKELISDAIDSTKGAFEGVGNIGSAAPHGGDVVTDSINPDAEMQELNKGSKQLWNSIKKKAGNFWDKIKPKSSPTSGLIRQGYKKIGGAYVKK